MLSSTSRHTLETWHARDQFIRSRMRRIMLVDPSRPGFPRLNPTAIEHAYRMRNCSVVELLREAAVADIRAGLSYPDDPAIVQRHPVVVAYVDLPIRHGQVSWRLAPDEVPAWLPPYIGAWDGHSVAEKYRRIARYLATRPV